MGTIINSRMLSDGRVKIRLEVEIKEALSLKGCVSNIWLFALDNCNTESKVIEKGREGVTKHFVIHPNIRINPKKPVFDVKCQRVYSDNKTIFVYVIHHSQDILNLNVSSQLSQK